MSQSLSTNWLDDASSTGILYHDTTGGSVTTVANTSWCNACQSYWCYCWPPSVTYVWPTYQPSKIRLTLSEIQKLRAAAQKDKALKAVLQKFTSHIEVEVEF